MSAPLRIGLLGASRIAELAIIEASRDTGDVRAAVAARDPERARVFASKHDFESSHADYEALIADESLDLLYIGLPNGLHAEWTVKALRAGRSVLVEKPFAANLGEFDVVAAELERATGWAWEAFHYADHPLMSRLLDVVRSGEIGELREVQVAMLMPSPPATDPRWNFELAGGTMMDLGCYAVNALLVLADALALPVSLATATGVPHEPDARLDASIAAELRLGDVPATLRASMVSAEWEFSFRVIGERGEVRSPNFVKPQEDDRLLVTVGSETREERTGTISSYAYQLRRIREALHAGERSAAELDRSRRTMELIDAIYTLSGFPLRPGSKELHDAATA
ncbi:putative dehydrogenase [Leucobacter luti]|uniref:Putative dehydrogenase n=1 Tax=Leucobacter luti TaxID=340320 RepID=A0A4R6S254_9MICO|nr:Gfo/Idh/MocA family oxidoreductase [Leucobacter luti]TDP93314.1 putative dehydrogenase [Leucobacter luti]